MAVDKYLYLDDVGKKKTEKAAKDVSVGAGDAGSIVALNTAGDIDISMMPPGISADTSVAPASENLSAGDLVNIWNDAGTIKVRKADASNAYEANGFVTASVTLGGNATVFHDGTISGLTGLTPGARYFLSTTAGGVALAPATLTGELWQEVGKAKSLTEIVYEKHECNIRA